MKRLAIVLLGLAAFAPQLAHARCSEVLDRNGGMGYICDGGMRIYTDTDTDGNTVAAVPSVYSKEYRERSGATFDESYVDPQTLDVTFYFYPTESDWEGGASGDDGPPVNKPSQPAPDSVTKGSLRSLRLTVKACAGN